MGLLLFLGIEEEVSAKRSSDWPSGGGGGLLFCSFHRKVHRKKTSVKQTFSAAACISISARPAAVALGERDSPEAAMHQKKKGERKGERAEEEMPFSRRPTLPEKSEREKWRL